MKVANSRCFHLAVFALAGSKLVAEARKNGRQSPFPTTALAAASTSSTAPFLLTTRGGAIAAKKRASALTAESHHHGELMSAPTAVANVLADLCPHGMLPIAFGMAAGGGTGPVLATIILFIFGVLSWYSLVSFARYEILW